MACILTTGKLCLLTLYVMVRISTTEPLAKDGAKAMNKTETQEVLQYNSEPQTIYATRNTKTSSKWRKRTCSEKVQQLRIEIDDMKTMWKEEKEELNMKISPLYRVEKVAEGIKEVLRGLQGGARRATVRLQSALHTLEHVRRAAESVGGGMMSAAGGVDGAREAWAVTGAPELGAETVKRPLLDEGNNSALPPLRDLVTVLLEWGPHPIGPLRDVVGALKETYGAIQVVVSIEGMQNANKARRALRRMRSASVVNAGSALVTPGLTWNVLAGHVTTPLALLLRDVAKFSAADAALPRLVRVLSLLPQVDVVGSAYRNGTGHWRFGCHQTTVRNSHLHYVEGYHHSAEDCAYCDHVSGSFLVRTSVLKGVPFSQTLPSHVLFEDWFLRIKERDALAMVCPDSMFLTHSHATDVALRPLSSPARSAWLPLARAHGLSSVHVPPRVRIRFNCSEVDIECYPFKYYPFLLIPTCCFKQVAQSLDLIDSLRRLIGLSYNLHGGSQLGAVKGAGFLPWDVDADIDYNKKAFRKIWELRPQLRMYGIELEQSNGKFIWHTPEMQIDLFSYEGQESSNVTKTLVQLLGRWLPASPNPGQSSRSTYGPDILTHVFGKGLARTLYLQCPILRFTGRKLPRVCHKFFQWEGTVDFAPLYFTNMGFDWENDL